MKASTVYSAIISFAVVASAVPTADVEIEARTDKSLGSAASSCSANQVVSCCNTSGSTFLGGLLNLPILGNSCNGISASLLSILSPSSTSAVCGASNSAKCCEGSKNTGLLVVNVPIQCNDIL